MAFGSEQHAASLARPGGNVTGVAYSAEGTLLPKRFELLKEMVPTAKRIGMLDDGFTEVPHPPLGGPARSAVPRRTARHG